MQKGNQRLKGVIAMQTSLIKRRKNIGKLKKKEDVCSLKCKNA